MNALLHWLTAPEWGQLVKTLLHSLWQGALAALILAMTLRRLNDPRWRYRAAFWALASIPVAALITWSVLNSQPLPSTPPPTPLAATPPITVTPLNVTPDVTAIAVVNRASVPTGPRWTAWLALLWMIGVSVTLTRGAIKVAGAEHLRRASQPLANAEVHRLLAEARRVMRITRRIRLAATDRLTSPAVVGVVVPTLILPMSLVTTLTPEQIRFVLLHELAHIRRGDYLANLLQLFVESLLFFNPAVWWLSYQVRREREACCDALAIELSGSPADYARTLLRVAESAIAPTPVAAAAFGATEHAPLLDRVQRLLVPGYQPTLRLTWRAMLVAFVLGGVLLLLLAEGTRVAVAEVADKTNRPVSLDKAETANANSTALPRSEGVITSSSFDWEDWIKPRGMNAWVGDVQPQLYQQWSWYRVGTTVEAPDPSVSAAAPKSITLSQTATIQPRSDQGMSGWTVDSRPPQRSTETPGASQPAPPLYMRTFTVAPQLFTNAGVQTPRDFFRHAGIDLDPATGRSVYFSDRRGALLVRATAEELDRIESILSPHEPSSPVATAQPKQPIQISGLNPKSSITHDLVSGKTTATGGSVVQMGDNKLQADTIELDTRNGNLTASGNVQVESPHVVADASRDDRSPGTNNPHRDSPTNLVVRTYRVDPNTFYQGLESVTSRPLNRTNMQESVRAFFTSLGVDLNPPRSVFFNDGAGEIFVRAPKADLDVIESALHVLNMSPPQVNIKVRFVELDAKPGSGSLESYLGNLTPGITASANAGGGRPASGTSSNAAPQQFTGILTEPQYRAVLRALEQRKDANVLAMQEVTTLSGRQAQIQTVELRTVVNGLGLPIQPLPSSMATNSATNLVYQTQVLPFGPVLDLIPFVAADGYTIQLTAIPSVTEFLGYDDPEKLPKSPKATGGENTTLPLPRVRVRQVTAEAKVWDGQTLVLSVANDQVVTKKSNGGFVKENLRAPEVKKKQLLVFITPTIIDQAGNRANAATALMPMEPPLPRR